MTKTPAAKTASKKPVAKKATGAAKKPASAAKKAAKVPAPRPKGAAKPSAPAHKAGAKPKPAAKAGSGKPAAPGRGGHKAAAKAAPKPAPKPLKALKPAPKPPKPAPAPKTKLAAAVPAPAKPGSVKTTGKAAPVAAGTPPVGGVAPAPVKRALSSRAAARASAAPAQAPLPLPTSRFADRFAPPRPPTRQMAKVELDAPRRVHISDPRLADAWKTKSGRDMTEAEILAMPESEYMNDKQLEFFRCMLQALKDSLLSNAGETTEHLREDTSIVPDPADRATIEEEHALELRTRDRERKLLKKITQSLARIEAGEYGFCDETGEPIGLGRLIARPTATLSLEAQQRRELKQKMFGD